MEVGPARNALPASFEGSLFPMLVADDRRRFVDANPAACLFLRVPRERVLELTLDELTPPENRDVIPSLWEELLGNGTQSGPYELLMPDGQRMEVTYCATANYQPGRHVAIFEIAGFEAAAEADLAHAEEQHPLSEREREVLARIAAGETSRAIADTLRISPTTVETHVRHCLAKLGAKNRPHAIALALQRGEIALV